ncbi:hypothetical protein ACJJIE_17705 [Microbulbifer sp. TRSA001]|uniref:hypothetical protein n=1 Tax=Microbulbifer sp. TRSA001 TaxID=3243381 RepID=UPI00403A01F4
MKITFKNITILSPFLMLPSPFSFSCTAIDSVRFYETEVEVVLREWNQKGFGNKIETSTITIITAPDYKGDIVILRNNDEKSGFTAEVYKPKPNALTPDLWKFVSGNVEKSIVKQPNGTFHLSEVVDNGVRVEIINLNNKSLKPMNFSESG